MQNTHFSWLSQVVRKSPGPTARTLERKIFEKFSKCFSRLEVSLMRESRSEPRKSLCTFRDWTFHLWISCQIESRETLKTQMWLGHWLASEPRKIFVWVRNWDMRLNQPVTKSPKQGNTVFEILTDFCKNKILSKNN